MRLGKETRLTRVKKRVSKRLMALEMKLGYMCGQTVAVATVVCG